MPARNARQEFVRKFWSPVNTPLRDETGHLIGAVHNVQDVTTIVESMDDTGPSSETGMNLDQQTWTSMVTAIAREALGHQRARQHRCTSCAAGGTRCGHQARPMSRRHFGVPRWSPVVR